MFERTENQEVQIPPLEALMPGREGVKSLARRYFRSGLLLHSIWHGTFFIPIILAVVVSLLLSPLVRIVHRLRLPLALSSAVVMVCGFALLVGVLFELSGPVSEWLGRVPQISSKLQHDFEKFRKPVQKVAQATEQVQNLASGPKSPRPP
jgi:predicted PurR-regulated permease PerM